MGGGAVDISKKYTLRSSGVWERVRKMLALVPNRSTGNPIVPLYRVPSTGSRPEAHVYTDPSTLPAADIAENPYFKRDVRRNYPRLALYSQSDIGGLLKFGSTLNPRIADGDASVQAVATAKAGGLSLIEVIKSAPKEVILSEVLKDGLPPLPGKAVSWEIVSETESGMYTDKYPVRMFK
ncbi:uncharacterized protein V1510DRAFT_427430 [Dipodascopsis tothii]|uniref:uncharacterized protein n=1 Tax=Dipodascopsis tothii TaxID=44089 RepID=UPI0034CD864A